MEIYRKYTKLQKNIGSYGTVQKIMKIYRTIWKYIENMKMEIYDNINTLKENYQKISKKNIGNESIMNEIMNNKSQSLKNMKFM